MKDASTLNLTPAQLCEKYLYLVELVSWRFRHSGVPRDELKSEGLVALAMAVLDFDYTLGYSFTTLAVLYIQRKMSKLARTERHRPQCLSLDDMVHEGSDTTFLDSIADTTPPPYARIEREEAIAQAHQRARTLISRLPDDHQRIIAFRHGVFGQRPHSLEETAAFAGKTKRAISSMISRDFISLRR